VEKNYRSTLNDHDLIFAGCVFALLIGPWYAVHMSEILQGAIATRHNVFSVPYENLLSFSSVIYYAKETIEGMMWPFALLSIYGVFQAFRRHTQQDWFLIVWIFIPYILLTSLYSKEGRYFLPAYPALAILAASGIRFLKRKLVAVTISLSLLVGILVWTETSWGLRLLPFTLSVRPLEIYGYQRVALSLPVTDSFRRLPHTP